MRWRVTEPPVIDRVPSMATEPTTTSPSDAIVDPAGAQATSPGTGDDAGRPVAGFVPVARGRGRPLGRAVRRLDRPTGGEARHGTSRGEGDEHERPPASASGDGDRVTRVDILRTVADERHGVPSVSGRPPPVTGHTLVGTPTATTRRSDEGRALGPDGPTGGTALAGSVVAGSAGHRAVVERRTGSDVGHTGVMEQLDDATVSDRARRLAGALEPFAGQVYFSPECHANDERLGFTASPGDANGVALPDGPAYFTSRGSVMGQVAGEVVAAAFAVFNPAIVVPLVDVGWSMTDAATICAARRDGATAQLRAHPGRRARRPRPRDRAARRRPPWACGPRVGRCSPGWSPTAGPATRWATPGTSPTSCASTAATATPPSWIVAGIDATEIGLLTELFWGLPMRSYVRSRAWSNDELDAAEARLVERGWLADGAFTDAGRAAREQVELVTDLQCRPIIENLGDGYDELVGILEGWGAAIRDAKGYLGSGPHDLARGGG